MSKITITQYNGKYEVELPLSDDVIFDGSTNKVIISLAALNEISRNVNNQLHFRRDVENYINNNGLDYEYPEISEQQYFNAIVDKYEYLRADATADPNACLKKAVDSVVNDLEHRKSVERSTRNLLSGAWR